MKAKLIVAGAFLSIAASFVAACRGANPSNEKVIKSVKSGELTITISSSTGELKNGENDLMITTTEIPGKYRAQVNIEMAGSWEAQVKYQGRHGSGRESMTVRAK